MPHAAYCNVQVQTGMVPVNFLSGNRQKPEHAVRTAFVPDQQVPEGKESVQKRAKAPSSYKEG